MSSELDVYRKYVQCTHYCPNDECDYHIMGDHTDMWTAVAHNYKSYTEPMYGTYRKCLDCGYTTYNT